MYEIGLYGKYRMKFIRIETLDAAKKRAEGEFRLSQFCQSPLVDYAVIADEKSGIMILKDDIDSDWKQI